MRAMICTFGCALMFLLAAPPAAAQDTVNDVIGFLVTNRSVRTGDFERDRAAAEAARETIARALLVNLTSVPLATSSGGFVYRLNRELGTVERASESFGGFFVERALTAGAGRATIGFTAHTSAFDRLDGIDLRDGSFVTVANQFRDEATPFDSDTLILRVRTNALTVFGSVGVTNRLEIGAAVPFIDLRVDGERQNTYFGAPFTEASGQATARGIGDLALRAKYVLGSGRSGAFSAGFEVRLPTGDETNLLGTGKASYRIIGIGSYESGGVALNVNGGMILSGLSEELNVSGAASYALHPRFTVAGEMLVRHVADLQQIELVSVPHPSIRDVDTWRLAAGEPGVTLSRAVAGMKWNATGRMVIGAHVAFALAQRGLTAPLTPTVTVEYGF